MDVVTEIAKIAARVMMVALPVSATMSVEHTDAAKMLAGDVKQVLQMRDFPPVYIDEHATWSQLLQQGGERDRIIFIALVLGIYE